LTAPLRALWHRVPISLVLVFEAFQAGHGDHTRSGARFLQSVCRLEGDGNLGAAGDDRDLGPVTGVGEHIAAACRLSGGSVLVPVEGRNGLTGEDEAAGPVGAVEDLE